MNADRRVELYDEVQQILAEEIPVIPLWHEHNIAVMNKSVTNYHVLPNARLAGFAEIEKR